MKKSILRRSALFFWLMAESFWLLGQVAQSPQIQREYGANAFYGAIFRHRRDMRKLNFTHPFGLELYTLKGTQGRQPWHRVFNYPRVGFSLLYFNYNMPEELGEVVSATSYLDFSFSKKRQAFRVMPGIGVAWNSMVYDREANPNNVALSMHLNYAVRLDFQYEFQLSEKWTMVGRAGYRHYSNGRMQAPNNGINYLLGGMGLRYKPDRTQTDARGDFAEMQPFKDPIDRKWHLNLMAATGWRQIRPEEVTRHQGYSLLLYASKRVGAISNLVMGVEGFLYDFQGMRHELIARGISWKEEELDGRQLALAFGHELLLGRLAIITGLGYYLYLPYQFDYKYYQRAGVRYYLSKNLFLNTTVKAYIRKADMMEFGLGLRL